MEIIRHHFIKIHSTNTWAKEHVEEFPLEALTIVTADEQTSGRGRFNRKWISPASQNVYCTFCFFLPKIPEDVGNIPQVLSLSALTVLEKHGLKGRLKWPNDILISGKKVGGILCETTSGQGQFLIVVGIGLNVNMPTEVAEQIDRPVTSMMIESGAILDVDCVTDDLIHQFQIDIREFLTHSFTPFYSRYVHELIHVAGEEIRFHEYDKVWKGFFDSICKDGSINIRLDSGELKHFTVGEIPY